MFVVSEPTFPRTRVEKTFRLTYALGTVLLFAALVITLANYVYRLEQTYEGFGGSSAVLAPGLRFVLAGCSYNASFSIGSMSMTASIDENSATFAFISHALIIVGVVATMIVLILNDITAKMCFAANIRNFRMRGISVPVNTIAANAMLVQSIALIILIGASSSGRTFLNDYVTTCTAKFATSNLARFIAEENNVQSVFGTNLSLLVIAVAINLGIYLLAFVALCLSGWSAAAAEFENRKHFWEKPPFGLPNKKELFHFSRWRRYALESIERGAGVELAPVSYLEFMEDLEMAKANGDDGDEDYDDNAHGAGGGYDDDGKGHNHGSDVAMDAADDSNADDIDGEGEGDAADAFDPDAADADFHQFPRQPQSGRGGAASNPWMLAADEGADQPEELVMPEGFDTDGEAYPLQFRSNNNNGRSVSGGGYDPSRDAYSRPSGNNNNNNSQHRQPPHDVPFDRRGGGVGAPETDQQRRDRHQQRRAAESAEDREARKQRRRRAREAMQSHGGGRGGGGGGGGAYGGGGGGGAGDQLSPPWREDARQQQQQASARYGLAGPRPLPPPAPSP